MTIEHSHPLLKDSAILPTRPLEEFVNTIGLWMENLIPGGIVWGYQRVGKTRGIRYVIKNTELLFGHPVPMTLISTWDPKYSSLTENRFFGELLRSLGHAIPDAGTAQAKRHRIVSFIAERTHEVNEHRFLLFFDEAQWLHNSQLNYLMDIHNQLALQDIRLITILVGQPELTERKQAVRDKQLRHLMGRFMTLTHQFQGCLGRSDFRILLKSIDSLTEYPENSGQCYTKNFVPEAFEAGWRLEDQCDLIWDIFEEACRLRNLTHCKEWPLQGLMALVRHILRTVSGKDSHDLILERSDVEFGLDSVAIAQLADHALAVSDTSSPRVE